MIYANVEQYVLEYIASRLPLPGVDYVVEVGPASKGTETNVKVRALTRVGAGYLQQIGDDVTRHLADYAKQTQGKNNDK